MFLSLSLSLLLFFFFLSPLQQQQLVTPIQLQSFLLQNQDLSRIHSQFSVHHPWQKICTSSLTTGASSPATIATKNNGFQLMRGLQPRLHGMAVPHTVQKLAMYQQLCQHHNHRCKRISKTSQSWIQIATASIHITRASLYPFLCNLPTSLLEGTP
jgi:hypothetical protein